MGRLDNIKKQKADIKKSKNQLVNSVDTNKEVLGKINKHGDLRHKKAIEKRRVKQLAATHKELAKAVAAAAAARTEKRSGCCC